MLDDKFDYYATEYDPGKIASGVQPRSFAYFQKLHFKDSTFDVVIASDVFEHVRDDAAGYREIYRTLKSGGTLLLTVPYRHEEAVTLRRVDTSGSEDLFLMEPEYHGGGGHTLTYRTYGRDLLTLLRGGGYTVAHAVTDIPRLGITPQSVIIARKGDFVDLPQRESWNGSFPALGPLVPYRLYLLLKYNFAGFARILKHLGRS